MKDLEPPSEMHSDGLFPLDTDIIHKLRDSVITDVIDPDLAEKHFKEGHDIENALLLNYSAAVGGTLSHSNLFDIFTMSSIFTYAVINHTARARGLDVPIVTLDDIKEAGKILTKYVPKVAPAIPPDKDIRKRITQRYTDILSKPERELANALSTIVHSRLLGPIDLDRLQNFESTAHYGAGSIYFPVVTAQNRLAGVK